MSGVSIFEDFTSLLKTAHRIYGQYKRIEGFESFYNVSSFESLVGYKIPKRVTRGSIRRLEKSINKMRALKERYEYREIAEERRLQISWRDALRASYDQFKESNQGAMDQIDYTSKFTASYAEAGLTRLAMAIKELAYDHAVEKWAKNFKNISDIKDRIKKMKEYIDSIHSFISKYGEKMKRFAYAVIDTKSGGFNTNRKFWKFDGQGAVGRSRFNAFVDQLTKSWWIEEQADLIKRTVNPRG